MHIPVQMIGDDVADTFVPADGVSFVDWTAHLEVFEQDFDTAMAIWSVQDPAVERLCVDEPPMTRRRRGNTLMTSQEAFSQLSDNPMEAGRRRKKRRRVKGSEKGREAPPSPLSQRTSQCDEPYCTGTQIPSQVEMQVRDSQRSRHSSVISRPTSGASEANDLSVPNELSADQAFVPCSPSEATSEETLAASVAEASDVSRVVHAEWDHSGIQRQRNLQNNNVEMEEVGAASTEENDAPVASGFQTGSGRRLTVSRKRLREVEAHFEVAATEFKFDDGDVCKQDRATDGGIPSCIVAPSGVSGVFSGKGGFQTGMGRTLHLSEDAVRKYEVFLFGEGEAVVDKKQVTENGQLRSGVSAVGKGYQHKGEPNAVLSEERRNEYTPKLVDDGVRTATQEDVRSLGSEPSMGGARNSGRTEGLQMTGFQTAMGKSLTVSNERLLQYNQLLFADHPNAVESPRAMPSRPSACGFQTASGHDVVVSEVIVKEMAQRIFGEEYEQTANSSDLVDNRSTAHSNSPLVKTGFQTGSGASVRISQSTLMEYEKLIHRDRLQEPQTTSPLATNGDNYVSSKIQSGFQTGSGSNVSISEKLLREYEQKVEANDITPSDKLSEESSRTKDQEEMSKGVVLAGFTTGTGRSVSVSEEKLRQYQGKLTAEPVIEERPAVEPNSILMASFTTGTGRRVSVSEEKLREYEKKLTDDTEGCDSVQDGVDGMNGVRIPTVLPHISSVSTKVIIGGFTTGSGQQVSVSEEKLREYEQKLANESISSDTGQVSHKDQENRPLHPPIEPAPTRPARLIQSTQLKSRRSLGSTSSSQLPASTNRRRSLPPMVRPPPVLKESTTSAQRGVSAAVMNRMSISNMKHSKPLVLADVSNTPSARTSYGGLHRQSQDMANGYTTPAKKRPAPHQGHSLSTKKGFRPPVPLKTPPAKSIITPSKSQQHANAIEQSETGQSKNPSELIKMPFHEMMRVSYKLLISASAFDSYTSQSDARVEFLDRVDPSTALNIVFSAGNDLNFSFVTEEDPVTTSSDSMHDIFEHMTEHKYFGEDKGATIDWFRNHFRWVVWKLATMEKQFPRFLFGRYLTKSQVMYQLCCRYQRDLVLAQRSIVKKILHRDANAASCMVLRVAAVLPFPLEEEKDLEIVPPPYWKLGVVLTDGWYGVYASPDASLAEAFWKYHKAGRLIGMKIVTWSSSLQNSSDGIDPLECALATESQWTNPLSSGKDDLSKWPYLKLPFNSTRPVSATARLGLETLVRLRTNGDRPPRQSDAPYDFVLLKSVPLRTLEVGGGIIRSVRVRLTRISPILHLQPKDFTIGPRILCEEHMPQYFQARQDYLTAQKKAKGDDEDADEVSNGGMQPLPVPFTKLEVMCSHNELPSSRQAYAVLTVWRPSDEMLSKLEEGDEYYVSSLSISWKVDYGSHGVFLRLGTTKGSGFEHITPATDRTLSTAYQRACVTIEALADKYRRHVETKPKETKLFGDTCVLVLHVDEGFQSHVNASGSIVTTDHIFVTDQSRQLMSLRVSSTRVPRAQSTASIGKSSSAMHSKTMEHIFRRGSKKLWTVGAIVCISGLEVSHYDERLGLLDCELVESAKLVSLPSKKSYFYEAAQYLHTMATSPCEEACGFMKAVQELKKHIERRILLLDFEPTQEEEAVDDQEASGDYDYEADHLTQELSHQNENDVMEWTSQAPVIAILGRVVKLLPLQHESHQSGAFYDASAVAYIKCVSSHDDDAVLNTIYLPQSTLMELIAACGVPVESIDDDLMAKCNNVLLRFEAQWQTSERLLNSWKTWERDGGATFLVATSVSLAAMAFKNS